MTFQSLSEALVDLWPLDNAGKKKKQKKKNAFVIFFFYKIFFSFFKIGNITMQTLLVYLENTIIFQDRCNADLEMFRVRKSILVSRNSPRMNRTGHFSKVMQSTTLPW